MSKNGEAFIEGGAIVIRLQLDTFHEVVEGAWASMVIPTRLKITDAAKFAKEVCRELNEEQEDGTTPVHILFDGAIQSAFEQGAEGVEEHEDQDA